MRSSLCERKTLHNDYPAHSDFDCGADALSDVIFDSTPDLSQRD